MLNTDWNNGGGAADPRGAQRPSIRDVLSPLTGLTLAQLKAIPPDERFDEQRVVLSDGRRFVYDADSALTTDGDQLIVIPTVDSGAGRYVAEAGQVIDVELAIAYTTADAAVLYTVPTAAAVLLLQTYWEVTVGFTGGAASTIGLSSSKSGLTTKGDLLGGAGGDVAATLVTGDYIQGTAGVDMGGPPHILVATNTIRFDRITSAFTAGAGKAHAVVAVLQRPA